MREKGLYGKFIVYPAEAAGQLENYKPHTNVFVLSPETDPVARIALATYATHTANIELSRDLWKWIAGIEQAAE